MRALLLFPSLSICIAPPLTLSILFRRYVILPKDFDEAYKKLVKRQDKEFSFYST